MLQRVTREPALIVGVVTSGIGLAVLFGLQVNQEQTGGIVLFLGAVMSLVRFLTTPANQVVAQVKPGGEVVAGAAAQAPTGQELTVTDTGDLAGPVLDAVPINPELVND